MAWHDNYPHFVYQEVLLLNGKIIDWKISGSPKRSPIFWSFKFPIKKEALGNMSVETNVIEVNNEKEHNDAFNNYEWFKQFENNCKFKNNWF